MGRDQDSPPFLTFEERLNLYMDDLKVELIYVGPAHTTNDVIAWVPEGKVLFTGDVIFNPGTPFAMMGSIAGWLEAPGTARALGSETIVPGHGPACGPEVIDEVAGYLRFVQETAQKGSEAGLTPLETAQQANLGVPRVAGRGAAGGLPALRVLVTAWRTVGHSAAPSRGCRTW